MDSCRPANGVIYGGVGHLAIQFAKAKGATDVPVRLIAVAGLVWLSFMFALTFTDYLFRPCDAPGSKAPHSALFRRLSEVLFD